MVRAAAHGRNVQHLRCGSGAVRYEVRSDGPNRYGVEFWSIVDTENGLARVTWTNVSLAYEQCLWLNAHADRQPETVVDARELAREAAR